MQRPAGLGRVTSREELAGTARTMPSAKSANEMAEMAESIFARQQSRLKASSNSSNGCLVGLAYSASAEELSRLDTKSTTKGQPVVSGERGVATPTPPPKKKSFCGHHTQGKGSPKGAAVVSPSTPTLSTPVGQQPHHFGGFTIGGSSSKSAKAEKGAAASGKGWETPASAASPTTPITAGADPLANELARNPNEAHSAFTQWLGKTRTSKYCGKMGGGGGCRSFVLHHMGRLFEEHDASEKKLVTAEKYYRSALETDSGNIDARVSLASLLGRTGRREEARQLYEDALGIVSALSPQEADTAAADDERAKKRMEFQNRRNWGQRPRLLKNYALLLLNKNNIGGVGATPSDRQQAFSLLKRCSDIDPNNASVFVEMGDVMATLEEAEGMNFMYYCLARDCDPDNNVPHFKIGQFYAEKAMPKLPRGAADAFDKAAEKEHKKAREEAAELAEQSFAKAIACDPHDSNQWFHLGRLHETLFAEDFVKSQIFQEACLSLKPALKPNKPAPAPEIILAAKEYSMTPFSREAMAPQKGLRRLKEAYLCYLYSLQVGENQHQQRTWKRKRVLDRRFPFLREDVQAEEMEKKGDNALSARTLMVSASLSFSKQLSVSVGTLGLDSATSECGTSANGGPEHGTDCGEEEGCEAPTAAAAAATTAVLVEKAGGGEGEGESEADGDGDDSASEWDSDEDMRGATADYADYVARLRHAFSRPTSQGGVLCVLGHPMRRVERKPPTYGRQATWACEECHLSIGFADRVRRGAYYCRICKYDLCDLCADRPRKAHFYAAPPEEIGKGGMGRILKAFDPSRGVLRAVKQSTRGDCGMGENPLAAEHRAMRACRAPNVVAALKRSPLADDPQHTQPSFGMELMGPSLHELIAETGPVHEATARQWICDVLCALRVIGGRRYVHRDIKPSNILMVLDDDAPSRFTGTDYPPLRGRKVDRSRIDKERAAAAAAEASQKSYNSTASCGGGKNTHKNNKGNKNNKGGACKAKDKDREKDSKRDEEAERACTSKDTTHKEGNDTAPAFTVARRVKLADFGIAKRLPKRTAGAGKHASTCSDACGRASAGASRQISLESSGLLMRGGENDSTCSFGGLTMNTRYAGTDGFACPESQRGGLGSINHKSDVYSLGVTWHTLLTASGAKPQFTKGPGGLRIVQFNFPVHKEAASILALMLSPNPDDRPDAGDLLKYPYFSGLCDARSTAPLARGEQRASVADVVSRHSRGHLKSGAMESQEAYHSRVLRWHKEREADAARRNKTGSEVERAAGGGKGIGDLRAHAELLDDVLGGEDLDECPDTVTYCDDDDYDDDYY